jgi:hypothetical protein
LAGRTFTILDTLGTATPTTTFPGPTGAQGIGIDLLRGPRFTLRTTTTITEIGAFLTSGRCTAFEIPTTLPLVVRIVGSVNGLPDPTVVFGTFELPRNERPDIVSYQRVTPNIVLDPGTYFALFASQSADDCGGLTSAQDVATPLDLGSIVEAGEAIVERLNIAARILGVRVPAATGTTKLLADGDVVLFEASGVAHRLQGAYPAITEQLTALVGRTVTVYGPPRRIDIPNYPILVQDFELVPGGALDGDVVVLTGPARRLADGDIIVDDEFGHGHRLRPTATVSASELEALVRQRVRIRGRANVTNAASRTNWPIDVVSIAAV